MGYFSQAPAASDLLASAGSSDRGMLFPGQYFPDFLRHRTATCKHGARKIAKYTLDIAKRDRIHSAQGRMFLIYSVQGEKVSYTPLRLIPQRANTDFRHGTLPWKAEAASCPP